MAKDPNNNSLYEFKGSTEANVKLILSEIQSINFKIDTLSRDVGYLKNFRSYMLGIGAAAGFFGGIVKGYILKTGN